MSEQAKRPNAGAPHFSRRDFLGTAAAGMAASAGWPAPVAGSEEKPDFPLGKAEHCIFVWLGGGVGQTDTWDPKRKGDPKAKKPGGYYDAIDTAVPGVQLCKHLARVAERLDRFSLVRTVNHDVIDEHAAAVNRMHTGRPTSGTIVYPSIGSIVAHEKPADGADAPPYVVCGYPNLTRGPGFLGAKHGYLYLIDTEAGPAALTRPEGLSAETLARRERLLAEMRKGFLERQAGARLLADYDATLERAERLSGPQFMKVFQLDSEPAPVREAYGGEFGQRCLLARRLIEAGTSFVEVAHNLNFVNGTGWDVHNQGILNQHLLIEELDQALAALVDDLADKKLLDKTLVVVSSEFGRPAGFDGGGGRGHHPASFSVALAGGGLKLGRAVGTTDELGMKIADRPVSVPDLFATMVATLGIDPREELYDGDRPVPITDMGTPIAELFG